METFILIQYFLLASERGISKEAAAMKIKWSLALVQGLILICFSLMIVHLILTGTIVLYISSKLIYSTIVPVRIR